MKTASAGTLESGDIFIELSPNGGETNNIKLDSIVVRQFGKQIKNVIKTTLQELEVTGVDINATDKGALDCTIIARVTAAVMRSREQTQIKW